MRSTSRAWKWKASKPMMCSAPLPGRAAEQGLGVKIITGDRDLLQLVNERTTVYLAGDDQNYITDEDVIKKLGVRPDQVVDYKALVGDKSDNIPGVAGIGEKTAIALIEKFGTLDNIYQNIDQVENRWSDQARTKQGERLPQPRSGADQDRPQHQA